MLCRLALRRLAIAGSVSATLALTLTPRDRLHAQAAYAAHALGTTPRAAYCAASAAEAPATLIDGKAIAAHVRAEVKEHEAKLRERKQQEMQGILKRNRKAYERKGKEEEKATLLREKEVARMEREEMKLIQKLKKTQVMQQQAFEDLENALNGDLSHLTQVEEPSPVKLRREESKDPEPEAAPAEE